MGLTKAKVDKIAAKLQKKLIGSFGDLNTLGNDLIIKKYSLGANKYREEDLVFIEDNNIKGIIITSAEFQLLKITALNAFDSDFIMYVNRDVVVKSSVDGSLNIVYKALYKGELYDITKSVIIGDVANSDGMIQIISLKFRQSNN